MKPVTLRPSRYEGAIALLVGLGGLAHVASRLGEASGLWGLGLGSAGLTALGMLLLFRRITVADGVVEFRRVVNEHPDLRVPVSEIRRAEFNERARHFEVKTESATHRVRIGRDAAGKLAKALKEAGYRAR